MPGKTTPKDEDREKVVALPEDLHREVKAAAARKGLPLKEYVEQELAKAVKTS